MSLISLPLIALAVFVLTKLYKQSSTSLGSVDLIVTGFTAKVELLDDDDTLKNEIPPRFIAGCAGDMIEARRRWEITYNWRRDFEIDKVSAAIVLTTFHGRLLVIGC